MVKFNVAIILFLLFHAFRANSQEQVDRIISEITENFLQEDLSEDELQQLAEELQAIFYDPFDINTVTGDQLKELPFLNDFHIWSFLEYRDRYGRILSIKELALVDGLRAEQAELLGSFLVVKNKETRDEITGRKFYTRHKILNRYILEWPLRNGFNEYTDSLYSFFGPPVKRMLKYEMKTNQGLSAGTVLESDPGEASVVKHGFDFYSGYIMYDNPDKKLRKLIVGDYSLHTGLGLVSGYGINRKSSQTLFRYKPWELKKYSSTAEYGYYRGMASETKFHKITSINYITVNRRAARLSEDSSAVTGFYEAGLFRNEKEIQFRNKALMFGAGTGNYILLSKVRFGFHFQFYKCKPRYFVQMDPGRYSASEYRKTFVNHSLSWTYHEGKIMTAGELAFDLKMNKALFQWVNLYVHPLLTLSIAYRNYSPSYSALNSSTFSENTGTANEKGVYFGFESYPIRVLKLNGYIDYYHFPWLNYNDTGPGSGTDFLISSEWTINWDFSFYILFKTETASTKDNRLESGIPGMKDETKHRYVLKTDFRLNDQFILKNKLEIKASGLAGDHLHAGLLLYQELSGKTKNEMISVNLRYSLFNIPEWNNRIYAWEPDLLYAFASPAYYRQGQSYLFNLRVNAGKFSLGFKFSSTHYNSEIISGSGPDQKTGRVFRTLKVQWVWKTG